MKTQLNNFSIWLLLTLVALAPANLAQQMNYQGRLTDANGNALQDGQYTLTFDLYDAPESGAKVWGPFVYDGGSGDGHAPKADLVNGRFLILNMHGGMLHRSIDPVVENVRYASWMNAGAIRMFATDSIQTSSQDGDWVGNRIAEIDRKSVV